jgi:uncharacterized membrane protein
MIRTGGNRPEPASGAAQAPAPAAAQPARPRPDWVPWLIAAAVLAAYLVISLSRYLQLAPGSWDLGIFTEYVRQLAHLRAPVVNIHGPGFNLLGDHFQPIVALIVPFFLLFPSPATLLVAQALLTAVSVIPVSRAAAAMLGRGAGWAIGAAYGFSWGLAQMIDFDFHEIAFAVPLLAFSLSALVRGRTRAAVLWALPLVFVKEDQGFTVAALGIVMIIAGAGWRRRAGRPEGSGGPGDSGGPGESGRAGEPGGPGESGVAGEPGGAGESAAAGGRPEEAGESGAPAGRPGGAGRPARWLGWADSPVRGGLVLVIWGSAWSVLAIAVIIPHFNAAHQYPYWTDGGSLQPGAAHSAASVLGQFGVSWVAKLRTTLLICLPVAFLALGSPVAAVALPSLALRFVSTNSAYWGSGFHYNATVMPIVFLAAIDALARARASSDRRWVSVAATRAAPAVMVGLAVLIAPKFPLQDVWQPGTYQIGLHVQAEDAALARVPPDTTVEATLTMIAPLAARDDTYWIGTSGNPAPAWIVFDESDSGWSPAPSNPLAFVEQRHGGAAYRQVFVDNDVYVFRRVSGTFGR